MTSASEYDHDRTVTAFFDTRAAADKAKADVVSTGVPNEMVSIVEGSGRTSASDPARSLEPHPDGFWHSLKNLFAPEEDKHVYAEGLSRGGYLLTAHTSDTHYDRVLDILDKEGAVDMDERASQWKSEGWSGRHDAAPAVGTSMAAARGLETPVAYRDETSEAATLGTAAPAADLKGKKAVRGTPVADTAVGARDVGLGQETIQLAEESLRVGKRDVNHGRVRLRSYVVEKPVQESVNLRSEQVNVSRRPVDRTLGAGENLFQERTINAEEHSEEAVVSKEARVVEEIALGKTVQDRTQEINDTVRKTEVEVDDARAVGGRAVVGDREALAGGAYAASSFKNEIVEHMDVLSSDGTKVGTVDHLDGADLIKLAKHDSPDGMHHTIPLSWVDHVDTHVHLTRAAADVRSGWTAV